MVNLGSSLIQTMMGPGPQCYIISFKVMGHMVPEKNILNVLPCKGVAAILGIWPRYKLKPSNLLIFHLQFGFDLSLGL